MQCRSIKHRRGNSAEHSRIDRVNQLHILFSNCLTSRKLSIIEQPRVEGVNQGLSITYLTQHSRARESKRGRIINDAT